MDFVYNQLLRQDKSISELQRLYPTMDRVLEDIGDLNRFKDLYTSTSLEGVAKGTVALESLHDLRVQYTDFVINFNKWADIIRGLQVSVEELKKENAELRSKISITATTGTSTTGANTATTASSNKSVSSATSTTATVGPPQIKIANVKSILKK